MKKILFAAVLGATVLGASGAASAASFGGPYSINQTERDIAVRIDRGAHDGSLTPREAGALRGELRNIERIEARYRRDGLSRWERDDLARRLDALSARVHGERHDRDFRGDGHRDRRGY
jgi:hypothetical protein